MISKQIFDSFNAGDILLMSSGACRVIIGKSSCTSSRVRKSPRVYYTFNKLNNIVTTLYGYCDLKNKIVGIFKIK